MLDSFRSVPSEIDPESLPSSFEDNARSMFSRNLILSNRMELCCMRFCDCKSVSLWHVVSVKPCLPLLSTLHLQACELFLVQDRPKLAYFCSPDNGPFPSETVRDHIGSHGDHYFET